SGDIHRTLFVLSPFMQVVWVSVTAYGLIVLLRVTGHNIGAILLAVLSGALVSNPQIYSYDPCQSTRHLNILISTVSKMSTDLATRPQNVFIWFDRYERVDTQPCFNGLAMADLGRSLTAVGYDFLGGRRLITVR